MNWTVVAKTLRELDWGLAETGRSVGGFAILVLALVLLLAPAAAMLALAAGIGFCFAEMFGGGFTTGGLTAILFGALMIRYIGPVVQPRVKIAVLALVAESPKR